MKIVRINYLGKPRYGKVIDKRIIIFKENLLWEEPKNIIGETAFKSAVFEPPLCPRLIFGVGMNFKRNYESGQSSPNKPVFFLKSPSSITSHNKQINIAKGISKSWGEPELACIISKELKNVSYTEAKEGVFGYTIANDVTSDSVDQQDHHLARFKSADTFCPIGPVIDTEFKIEDNSILGFQDNVEIRRSKLSDMILPPAKIISEISKWSTLKRGDLVLTGAPIRKGGKKYLENGTLYKCVVSLLSDRF